MDFLETGTRHGKAAAFRAAAAARNSFVQSTLAQQKAALPQASTICAIPRM